MIDRLRFMLDQPLDPLAARGVVVFATAVLLGFVVLFVLGAGESSRPAVVGLRPEAAPRPGGSFDRPPIKAAPPAPSAFRQPRQDPQDAKGSPAASRATRALRFHRALQHVPYRRGLLSVRLVGARGGRAVLIVSAPTISAARSGWRRFLRQYRDSGRSYIPHFSGSGTGGSNG